MPQQAIDLTGVSVQIGIPIHGHFPPETVMALLDTVMHLKDKSIPFEVKFQYGCSIIEQARCFVADNFLHSTCTHLFMIDADVVWTREDFVKVLALATQLPVVAAIYPVKREPETWFMKLRGVSTINEYGCLPVDGLGLGFCCVQRRVIEALAIAAPKLRFAGRPEPVATIFRCDSEDGCFRGEDMAFYADVRALNFDVFLDPSVQLGHIGSKEYRGCFLDAIAQHKVPTNGKTERSGAGSTTDHRVDLEPREQDGRSEVRPEGIPDLGLRAGHPPHGQPEG